MNDLSKAATNKKEEKQQHTMMKMCHNEFEMPISWPGSGHQTASRHAHRSPAATELHHVFEAEEDVPRHRPGMGGPGATVRLDAQGVEAKKGRV